MKAKYIFLLILVFLDIGFLANFAKYNNANKIFSLCCFFITIALIISIVKDVKKNQLKIVESNTRDFELIQNFRNGIIPRLESCALILKANEFACNEVATYLLETKNKAVGNSGGSGGLSVKVAKGIYVHSRNSASKKIYKNITEQYYGTFIITNQRVVFLNDKKGFEIPYQKLTGLFSNGKDLVLQAQSKSYTVFTNTPKVYEELIRSIIKIST